MNIDRRSFITTSVAALAALTLPEVVQTRSGDYKDDPFACFYPLFRDFIPMDKVRGMLTDKQLSSEAVRHDALANRLRGYFLMAQRRPNTPLAEIFFWEGAEQKYRDIARDIRTLLMFRRVSVHASLLYKNFFENAKQTVFLK